ncbi:MAG: Crp/Fnr family transcriptional regulator [Bacteroidota bacterium]
MKYENLTLNELKKIDEWYQDKSVKKGEFLLRAGEICRFEGFVLSGCFKVFTINDKGEEKILYFAISDWWLMDTDSFTNQIPSELTMQAIQDSTLLTITTAKKEELYKEVPKMERVFRLMSQKAVAAWQRRLIRNHTMSAEERYSHFIESYPEMAANLTNKHIASYLGITQEFVSVIRKRRQEKGS